MTEHVEPIVDEVSRADGRAVTALFGTLAAEQDAVLPDVGSLEKRAPL